MVRRLKPGEASDFNLFGKPERAEGQLTDNCLNSARRALAPFSLSNSLEGGNLLNGQKPDFALSVWTLW